MQAQALQENILFVSESREEKEYFSQVLSGCGIVVQVEYDINALRIALDNFPEISLILLEAGSQESPGLEMFQQLIMTGKKSEIPVIVLIDAGQQEYIEKYLAEGAADYLVRPFRKWSVQHRAECQIRLKSCRDGREQALIAEMDRSNSTYEMLLAGLASMMESRNTEVTHHATRIRYYTDAMLTQMQEMGIHLQQLQGSARLDIVKASPLHDIGKIAIPDGILLRPGKLTPDEFRIMNAHAMYGATYIASLAGIRDTPFLQCCMEVCRYHHEKWDGTGYPDGLLGEEIPFPARVVIIADIYDAMVTRRAYREALSHDQAVKMIREKKGTFFEPDLVDVFLRIQNRFQFIAEKWGDELGKVHPAIFKVI